MLKESAYDWAKIPVDLPKENLVLITAKTTLPTYHPEDKEGYIVRIFKPEELKEAARSLAKRVVGLNHKELIEGAFTVDAQWNESTQAIEALVYLPNSYINLIRKRKVEGNPVKWSVEYTWREENRTEQGVEFLGLIFDRVDMLEGLNAGDKRTETRLVEGSRRGLMEGVMVEEEKEIKQDQIQQSIDNPSLSFFKSLEEAAEFFRMMGEPFAEYKNFDDCVAKNSDKEDPKAYCATIMRRVEEPKKEEAEKFEPPESGDLPEQGKKILDNAYSSCRTNYPEYSKERCSKIAWGAVKNAGYRQVDDKWVKEESKFEGLEACEAGDCKILVEAVDKQIPEEMSKMQSPVFTAIHQVPAPVDKPEVNVGSIGFVADPKGEPIMFGNSGDMRPPEPDKKDVDGETPKTHDSVKKDNDSTPITGANILISPKGDQSKQKVESTEPKKEDKKETALPTPPTAPEPVPVPPVTPQPALVDKDKIMADKDAKIKQLEETIGRLQTATTTADSEKAKAVKEAKKEMKQELIKDLESILPPANIVQNFNRGGQVIVNDVRKKVHQLKESIRDDT